MCPGGAGKEAGPAVRSWCEDRMIAPSEPPWLAVLVGAHRPAVL
jgi:hypothetical protein